MTEHTITDPYEFKAYLARVRENGYATDIEEFGYGIVCYAAPIFDYTGAAVGAIGCSGSLVNCDKNFYFFLWEKNQRNRQSNLHTVRGGKGIYRDRCAL